MKKLFFAFIATLLLSSVYGQKLLIGSDAPTFKDVKWLTAAPAKNTALLVDFYQPTNPTCVKFRDRLGQIAKDYKGRIQVVLLTRETGADIDKLVSDGRFAVGYDPTGDVYTSFYVKYLPYSMLINPKGEITWIGNMGNLPVATLDSVK